MSNIIRCERHHHIIFSARRRSIHNAGVDCQISQEDERLEVLSVAVFCGKNLLKAMVRGNKNLNTFMTKRK